MGEHFLQADLEFSNEFTNQLLYCQSKMIQVFEAGGLAEGIHRVLSECTEAYHIYCGQQLPLMEVMTCIQVEQVFVDFNFVKGLRKNSMVKVIVKGRVTTRMKNNQLGLISELNPGLSD